MKLKESLRNLRNKINKKTAIITVALVIGVVGGSLAGVRYTSAFKGDCDKNAVMYCGGETVGVLRSKYNASADVRNIYAAAPFKISSQKMANSWSSMQRGQVGRDGLVKLNGKTVATNAVTAGRNYGNTPAIRAASKKMPGVNAYSRPAGANMGPSTSALTAFIKLDANGRFEFAIIRSCGNPVVATPTQPPAKPGMKVVKSVKKAGTKDEFKQDITVSPGQKVEYVVGVTNTGNIPLTNVKVRDTLPNHVKYVGYTTKVVRSYGATSNISSITTGTRNIGTMPVGGTAFIFFQATAPTVKDPIKVCDAGKTRLRNVAFVKPDQTPEKNDDAYIQTCKPATPPPPPPPPVTPKKPAISIDKKVNGKERDEVAVGETFTYTLVVKNTGEVDLKNAVVTDKAPAGVEFLSTDKGSVAGNKLAYTIPSLKIGKSETITIKAKATVYKQGDIVNTACVNTPEVNPGQPEKEDDCDDATVTVEEPAKPVYECTTLNAQSLGELKYRFTPVINMSGSVTVNQVSYDFNDGTEAVVQKNANPIEHTYVAADVDKTYTVTATVAFNVGEEVKSVDCVAQVKISPIPDVEPPVVPPVEPPAPEAPTPQPPVSIIPATGIGSAVSGLAGTIAASYGGYALLEARRKRA